jgi:hypothetical protein
MVEFIGHTSLIVILYLLVVVVVLFIVDRSVSCAQNNFGRATFNRANLDRRQKTADF